MTNEEFIQSIALPGEEWRDVPGLEDVCMASSNGRIISKGRIVISAYGSTKWKEPKLQIAKSNRYGYQNVTVSQNGIAKPRLVHRLVAKAFLANPEGKPEIDHIDANPSNNNVTNLRWCTKQENRLNPISYKRNNESRRGKPRPCSYSPVVAIKEGIVVQSYKTAKLAIQDGYSPAGIYQSCKGKRKTYRGMIWMYLTDYETLVQYIKELERNSIKRNYAIGANGETI